MAPSQPRGRAHGRKPSRTPRQELGQGEQPGQPVAPGRLQCLYPGCTRPAKLSEGRGAPLRYCYIDGHTPGRAHRARERLRIQAERLDATSDPDLLFAEILALRRANTGLHAELDTERHHHATHHPECPGIGHASGESRKPSAARD